jgi:hypothetical protein
MARKRKDDPEKFPPLGRKLLWLERPGSVAKVVTTLVLVCAFLVLSDFFYEKHGHYAEEEVPGFYAMYGFVMFTLLVLAARGLRVLVGVREDYYGNKAIDHEESYPHDQIEIKDYDDA